MKAPLDALGPDAGGVGGKTTRPFGAFAPACGPGRPVAEMSAHASAGRRVGPTQAVVRSNHGPFGAIAAAKFWRR